MNDRELLELAAKAAGLAWEWNSCSHCGIQYIPEGLSYYVDWAPLTDDGDALRLAVKCGMIVDSYNCRAIRGLRFGQGHRDWVYGDDDGDLDDDEATRRAIVRAAAAIGSAM